MLTPKHRALFAAAYSALLLHSPREEAEAPPDSSGGEPAQPGALGQSDGAAEQRRSA